MPSKQIVIFLCVSESDIPSTHLGYLVRSSNMSRWWALAEGKMMFSLVTPWHWNGKSGTLYEAFPERSLLPEASGRGGLPSTPQLPPLVHPELGGDSQLLTVSEQEYVPASCQIIPSPRTAGLPSGPPRNLFTCTSFSRWKRLFSRLFSRFSILSQLQAKMHLLLEDSNVVEVCTHFTKRFDESGGWDMRTVN